MKIVFNTDQIYLHGGIEKVMAIKANYWANIPGCQVYIVTTEQKKLPPCYQLNPQIKMIDLGVNYNRSISYFSWINLKKAVLHFKRQNALFNQLQPDVIISPNFNFDHYWLPFIKGKAKLIKERHSSRYGEEELRKNASFLQKLRFKINDGIDRRYTHIVVLNETEKQYVKSSNAVVIPNPTEPNSFTADLAAPRILAAGRISPVKGFDHLIQAWKLIHEEFPEWEVHIYGQDYLDTQKKLQASIDSNHLGKTVQFKGSVENLPETMTNYSLYAMTSQTECFPMVLLEAKSVGLPIVSYDCPNGPRHIIQHEKDGILVDNQNVKAFAQSLKRLMKDEALRWEMGKNAKLNSAEFSVERIMKQWSHLLDL